MASVSLSEARAQTELDPVTVTASLSRSRASATGRDIIVLKGESFRDLPVHSLDELLRYVPGVEVQQRGPQGAQADILIRGGTFQQVLVVLDGIRVNDPLTGHFNGYIPVTPSEIDRIEILKGAASAIYGSEAVGGVIHIITRAFSANHSANSFQAGVTAGEYGLLNSAAGGFYQKNGFSASAGLLSNNAGGQLQRGISGYFHNTTASGGLAYYGKNWRFGLQSSYDHRGFAAQNFYTAFSSDTATEKVATWWNHLKASYAKGKDSFSVDAGYKRLTDEYHFNGGAAPNLNHSSVLQSLALYTRSFSPKFRLTLGSQLTARSIRSNDRGDHEVNGLAGFALLNARPWEGFYTSASLRYEKGWVPQVSAAYRAGKLLLRAGAGRALRDADFTERYNNYGKTLVTSGNIGDPGLSPESAWSLEAGADYFIAPRWKASTTLFTKYYRDLVDWVFTPYALMPRKTNLSPAGSYYLARNISRLNTSGWEASLQYSSQSLEGMAGLTVINSSATTSLYISSHARLLLNYSLLYRYRFLSLSVNGVYKQREPQTGNASLVFLSGECFVLNTRLAAKIKACSFFINADNLLNITYADRFGVPMPGRWWSGGLSISFSSGPGPHR